MNRIYSIAVSAALMIGSLPLARASSKLKDTSVQAKAIIEQIDASSTEIADAAERLAERAKSQMDSQLHTDGLETLEQDVNSIGKELSALEAERASLAPWEVEALDRATSLMHEVAVSTEKAIDIFNTDSTHLWATSYPADMAKAAEAAVQVNALLSGYLKLAKIREREGHLERDLSMPF